MFCRNCGAKMADNARICMKCGVMAGDGDKFCSNCGAEPDPKAVICVKCGYELKPFSLPIQERPERPAIPPKGYDFGSAIRAGFNNYAIFQGRSTRTEFWYWTLFIVIVNGLLLCGLISGISIADETQIGIFGVTYYIFNLGTLLPSLAVTIRRLHDIGKSGWNFLVGLIPIIGTFILDFYRFDLTD
ncbi:DUF805 domain-containing protein [Alistipes shahii]|uniref:DUF805 domain-containing protein n=1 Tax=Alistipes shahii TaxID=328814 RepID=UPI0034A36F4A